MIIKYEWICGRKINEEISDSAEVTQLDLGHLCLHHCPMDQIPHTPRSIYTTLPYHYSIFDIVVALPQDLIENIIEHDVSALVQTWPYFPPIPSSTRRIWIYNWHAQDIAYVIRLDHHYSPARLYQLINPITHGDMDENDFDPSQIPSHIPRWISNRARSRRRVW
jgi:hypothetical protein